MKDYRVRTRAETEAYFEQVRKDNNWPRGHVDDWDAPEEVKAAARAWLPFAGHVRSDMPSDRRGLIAVVHDIFVADQPAEFDWHKKAKLIAKKTGQKVFVVMTTGRWHMMLFSIKVAEDEEPERDWYDDCETRKGTRVYANDQYIAHYDPDGTFHFDGAS